MIQALISAFAFGFLPIFAKLSYGAGLLELEILHYRFILAALGFLLALLIKNPALLKVNGSFLLKTAFIGLLICPLQSFFFFKALKLIPASTTSLILYFYPVVVTLASAFIFRFHLHARNIMALALVTFGCLLVFYQAFLHAVNPAGLLYALGAMGVFSTYMILMEKFLKNENPLTSGFYILLFTAFSYSLFHNPLKIFTLSGEQWVLSLLTGLLSTALSSYFLYRAIEKVGSAYTSIFSTFEPITTVLLAFWVLKEPFSFFQLAGMALIAAGIVLPRIPQIMLAFNAARRKS